MARKKARQSVAISDKCFRLLRLTHEIQSDVKVLKAVVDEVDVLRLCRSLGMAVSSESNSTHEFEFGMFDASDYDADFARFIREKLAGGGGCSAQQEEDADGEELLEIGCLFGKQREVKAELARLGFWGSECEDGLQPEDQGVYCIERGDGGGGRRQFVVFAWLDAGLFKPEAVRDTPAYVLRFLITLSSSITCCLSEQDFERIKAEVGAASDTSSSRWKSCSVSFRVQKQVEQNDSISCGQVSTLAIPKSDRVKSVWFVGGVFPAIAAESAAPSTTEWVTQTKVMPCSSFAEWLSKKHEEFAIQLPSGQLRPSSMRDYLLQSFDQFPYQELRDLRGKFEEHNEEAKRRIDREAFEWAKKIFDDGVHGASMLLAVRSPENSSHLDAVLRRYQAFLQQLENCEVLRDMDYCEYKMLYLPDRIQAQMKVLSTVFQRDPLAFDEVLNKVVTEEPIDPVNSSNRLVVAVRWLLGINDDPFSSAFRLAMTKHQPGLQRIWMNEVNRIVSMMQAARSTQRFQQSSYDRGCQFDQEEETAKQKAFGRFRDYLKSGNGHLRVAINRMILSPDETSVSVHWTEEVEKEPTKVIRLYQLKGEEAGKISFVGTVEVEPGLEIREVATVKMDQVITVLVKENSTIVRRAQFPLQPHFLKLAAEQFDVRSFPRACSLCAVRAIDRRVAFLFGARAGRLGAVAFCRFNEAFTSVELTHNIDMDASFGLAGPLVDILLTERSLCAVDGKGDLQSFDIRTRRTSKKVACEDKGDDKSTWVGGLLSFADELVVGRARIDANQQLCLSSISSEDHRALPTAVVGSGLKSKDLAVGAIDDVLYVVDHHAGTVYSSQLNVTVRSDAYRIERSGNAAKNTRQGCLQADKSSKGAAAHWLRVFYHVFEKFPVRSLVDMSMNPDAPFSLELQVAVADGEAMNDGRDVCVKYFHNLMVDLKRLNKPLSGLNLSKKLTCVSSEETEGRAALQVKSVRRALISIVSFVPVQICRAEDNMLKLLQDGEDSRSTAKRASATSSEEEASENGADASEIAQSIRFGLLSPLLESWNGRCVVVTSMGKQSTGKSYFLNHLAGTSFAISGSRCTDGAWMSLRFVSANVLLVVLDFEGLGSFERSEQEDIFLSVLNASVSLFTVFRMESRFDKDIDGLFSRFQKGVQLIKNDPRLFRGLLYMSVKDVNINDRQGVVDELVAKLDTIFESNKDQNFLTEMYAGQLEINCSPPFGTMDYYHCMENDAARTLCEIVSPSDRAPPGFVTGKSFLDCLRIVLAKISILDWTSMDKSTQNLLVADVKRKLPGILRTGCLVSLPLVGDKTIPLHLKEDVLLMGTRKKLVISMKELCEANPGFASKWTALNGSILLDSIADEAIDLGFDVTTVAAKKVVILQKMIDMLFQYFLTLLGKTYGSSRLTAEDQSGFDAFVAFVLLRRKLKVERWLRGMLGEHLSEVRAQLEQRYAHPLPVYLSRCQHKCAQCQLGCMHSTTHSPAMEHSCYTDHKCLGRCEYGECCADSDLVEAPPCSRSAGHEGKCECEKGEHTCGQTCVLAHASNCDKACSKRAEHTGDHRCSVQVHVCGAKCSADTCNATCLLDIQRRHSVHKCAEVQCLHNCLMDGCKNTCAQKDHFHGQGAASRAFAEESGMGTVGDSSEGVEIHAAVAHMCAGSHACPETCQIDGICEQKVHLKKSARTYTGARGSFEYIYQEMNGCKKHCAHVLASGEEDHEGSDHSCLAQAEGNDETTVHYCDVRCPSCSYYCNKHFGHMGLHATSHGNMRQTYFMAKTSDIDVEDRKYQVGERGIAEMCNLFCSKMGRGHTHYLSCESKDGEKCVYTADASEDHRRHCVDELFPPPGRDMDELLHVRFWSTIGWEDPCNEEERAEFAKCRFQCNAPEHDGVDAAASFCVLDAWHKPELKPEGAGDGFSYVNGHKFECVHTVDTGKFHSVLVLDSSGSMSGQPWQDLLCACNEFGIGRLEDGGENDLVSYITFDNESRIICEGARLPDALQMTVPFSGWGTKFEKGLRAANEVLSRNNFQEFKAALIFFSDGYPCDIELGIALAQHIRYTYARYDLKAFVVGFGYANLPVLQRMADEMGGEYRQVLDAKALRTEFQRIAAVLCSNEASLALEVSGTEAS